MSGVPSTPRGKSTAFAPTTPTTTTTTTSRLPVSQIIHSSPHYTTTRRHSLYGTEDRVVIDPGSRIWKVGFSGEGRPRDVFYAGGKTGEPLWGLQRATDPSERAEEDKLVEVKLQMCLSSLLTDPKSRKVILVEHPLLPLHIKNLLARILFDNLQVPSISFVSSHLLALLSSGRITGLVLDCGHLESTAVPIFASRPLYPHLRTTPLSGSRLTHHLRALLLLFGTYLPPTSPNAAANIPAANRSTRVPQEILTESVIEEIKTRCCFVGDALEPTSGDATRMTSPSGDDSIELDLPPTSDTAQSESEFSLLSAGRDSNISSQRGSSEFSVVLSQPRVVDTEHHRGEGPLQALATMYTRHSTATELHLQVVPPASPQSSIGRGTLIIPGWIRERGAEVLFEGGDVDESSVAEVILEALLKVPLDLRKTMASSILVVGGTAMLPGFIPRLHVELLRAISPSSLPQSRLQSRSGKPFPPPYDRYAPLRTLIPYFAILNNPSPPPSTSSRAMANAGKAPAFAPATMAWVGGSLAGSLKTGGVEVSREKWDESDPNNNRDGDESMDVSTDFADHGPRNILPDWTRIPLPAGAPAARVRAAAPVSPQAAVGA